MKGVFYMQSMLEYNDDGCTMRSRDIDGSSIERWTVRIHSQAVSRVKQIAAHNGITIGDALERLIDNAFAEMVDDLSGKE